jgi:phosphoheptose isomerase
MTAGALVVDVVTQHVDETMTALAASRRELARVATWGRLLAPALVGGQRLLVAGNGGSAAEAQHLSAELVGRFRETRRPFSAIALHAETSSVTAIVNDFGSDELFARQVEAHGRPGDVLLLLSTSGASPNVLRAALRGRQQGLRTWALTGPRPNPLAGIVDDAVAVPAASTAAIQEVHLVAVHALCAAVEGALEPGALP